MEKTQENNLLGKRYIIFAFSSVIICIAAVISGLLRTGVKSDHAVHYCISTAVMILIMVYVWISRTKMFSDKITFLSSLSCVFVSALLFAIFAPFTTIPFWIIGTVIAAGLINLSFGLFTSYFFLMQAGYFYDYGFTNTVIAFILSTLLCLFAFYMFPHLIKNDMADKYQEVEQANASLAYNEENAAQVFTAFETGKDKASFAYLESVALELDNEINNLSIEEAVFGNIKSEQGTFNSFENSDNYNFERFTDENSELLVKLRTVKKSAFVHSKRIAFISEELGEFIGANSSLCFAIGLYHEIHKCLGTDNFNEVRDILAINGIPSQIVSGVIQVADKSGGIFKSKEAAIVAITDTILTTFYFLKSQRGYIAPNKIVDNAMSKYMLSGRFNEIALSVKECADIRLYMIDKLEELMGNV